MNISEIDNFFPYDTYRDNQKETLEKTIKSFEVGNRIVIIIAPVGFGKSPEGITMGKMFNSAYYITPQKILQDQLGKDFIDKDFAIVKGRGNFKCLHNDKSCEYGVCVLEKIKPNSEDSGSFLESYCNLDPTNSKCEYKIQRDLGAVTKICNMNFAYFLVSKRDMFKNRELLIVDEAHSIQDWALEFVSTTISNKELDLMPKIPECNEFKDYISWIEDEILPIIEDRLNSFGSVLSQDEKKIEQKLENLLSKIKNMIDDHYINKEEWVWEIKREKFDSIKFQPIKVGRFMKNFIWNRADKILLMSGTILDPDMFLEEIGLDNEKYESIVVPSNFHYQYNPVLFYPVGKMSKDSKHDTLPKMVDKIREILSNHGSEKGIVHCHTYDIADYIFLNLSEIRHRLILQKRENREYVLKKFIESKDKILLSVNMNEGLDLKDDLARYQIILKVPYLFMGDKRVAKRVNDYGEDKWYNLQAVETICQAYGRAQRNEEDWSRLYILDESFKNLWNRYKYYFTNEFKNSYMYGQYLISCENADILPKT